MFPAIPGTVFRGEVADVLPAIGESQFQAGQTADHRRAQYPWPGAGGAEGDRSAFCRIRSAAGATLEAAVYSDHLKELSLIRKILMRMKSWENYIYLDHWRARGGRTAPRRGQASRPPAVNNHLPHPCEQDSHARAPHRRPPESRGDDRGRGAVAEQLACLEHQHVVGVTQGNIDVAPPPWSRCCAAGSPGAPDPSRETGS